MNRYRSNYYNVVNFDACDNIISKFEYNLIDRLYKNKRKLNENHQIDPFEVNIQMIGKGGQGTVYRIKAIDFIKDQDQYNKKRCGYIVIKITKDNNSNDDKNELKIMNACREIIDKHICPNFLYFYGIKNIDNKNKNNKDKNNKDRYRIIMSEYANGSLEDWLKNHHSYDEWRSFMFQFLMGVLCLQIKLKAYHSDLKPKNIFYKKLADAQSIFKYTIINSDKSQTFVVKTYSYLYIIADFGRIQSLLFEHNKLNKNSIELYIRNNVDLEHIITLPKRIMVNALEKIYTYDDLVDIIKLRNDPYFEGYIKNKKEEIEHDLKKYPKNIRDNMVYRSAAYYVVEKKYIDPQDIPDNMMVMKLPPMGIITELESWQTNGSMTILDILNTFTEYLDKNEKLDKQHLVNFKFSL